MFALFNPFDLFRPFRSGGVGVVPGIASALSDQSDLLHSWSFRFEVVVVPGIASALSDQSDLLHSWSFRFE